MTKQDWQAEMASLIEHASFASRHPCPMGQLFFEDDGNARKLTVLVASTPAQRQVGLSFLSKPTFDVDGMLFQYETPTNVEFSMANTYLPLQISFFDEGGCLLRTVLGEPRVERGYAAPAPFTHVLETFEHVNPPSEGATLDRLVVGYEP